MPGREGFWLGPKSHGSKLQWLKTKVMVQISGHGEHHFTTPCQIPCLNFVPAAHSDMPTKSIPWELGQLEPQIPPNVIAKEELKQLTTAFSVVHYGLNTGQRSGD